ncbi:MAG: ABC transporter ATP-binding protein [Anaerolineales bacterium]|nr:ABC transporter ATP-binding protein [Anaerolineales bacterium]MDW8161732.1 ABC transporter ATP-binding protein [Anaerolineales bacterium]
MKGISLQLQEGEIIAVLGANGAGKTTLLKVISGLVPIKSGVVRLMGQDLSKYLPHQLAALGMAHIPEGRRVFATLTVEENLNLGTWGVRHKLSERQIRETKEWIFTLFPILRERRKQLAGTLSGGEQQMLAIGRGLISKPKILLLDEPSLGLAPILVQEIFRVIRQIHEEEKVSILLVEQNARKALSIANYGYILETGKIAIQGTAAELRENEHVKAAYLGGTRLRNR